MPDDLFVLIGQLTDTHIVDPGSADGMSDELYVDNNARLRSAVATLNSEAPAMAVVLGTGDLTNWGRPGEYERLAELIEPLSVPFLALAGNHDDRELLRATFPSTPWVDAPHASWVTIVGGVRIVGLDSTIPGEPGGGFDDEREHWLRSVLGQPHDGATLLALHHPPFATGVGWMDGSGFAGLDRLEAVLADRSIGDPVDKVVCGHFHRPVSSAISGIPVQVGMSTVQHVDLDLAPGAGVSLIVDPVGYQIHRVAHAAGRTSIVTHTRYIDTPEPASTKRIVPTWADDF